jgi:hypothetical protein
MTTKNRAPEVGGGWRRREGEKKGEVEQRTRRRRRNGAPTIDVPRKWSFLWHMVFWCTTKLFLWRMAVQGAIERVPHKCYYVLVM